MVLNAKLERPLDSHTPQTASNYVYEGHSADSTGDRSPIHRYTSSNDESDGQSDSESQSLREDNSQSSDDDRNSDKDHDSDNDRNSDDDHNSQLDMNSLSAANSAVFGSDLNQGNPPAAADISSQSGGTIGNHSQSANRSGYSNPSGGGI